LPGHVADVPAADGAELDAGDGGEQRGGEDDRVRHKGPLLIAVDDVRMPNLRLGPDNSELLCPWCGSEWTHIEVVKVGARGEDKPPWLLTIHAVSGKVEEMPAFEEVSSRRQWVELVIDCESCKGGTIAFAQHKGMTLTKFLDATQQQG
jgi:hypothetical protein